MSGTKEKILLVSLELFSEKGYDAVSVSDIAEVLGVTKGALYRHFKNKRDIFESIVLRMEKLDFERAREFDVPEEAAESMKEKYQKTPLSALFEFTRAQFDYWTKEEFPARFRKMLTVEQFKNGEMKKLYSQYLVAGPFGYVKDILSLSGVKNAEKKAAALYSAMFFFFSLYDESGEKESVREEFLNYLLFLEKTLFEEGEKHE